MDAELIPAPGRLASEPAPDAELLVRSLEGLSGRESEIVDRFYALFFSRHPEVRELFGDHGVNEREEMIRETLTSVLAHVEDAPWLEENLEAMGRSHAEYGVEGPMYGWFVACMLDTLAGIAGREWTPGCREVWRGALERLCASMRRAGEGAR